MNSAKIISKVKQSELLNHILPILKKHQTYIVGGFLRDAFLLGEVAKDCDIVVLNHSARDLANEIAKELSGTLVELDLENHIYRVVVGEYYFDITYTDDIEKDAKRRDFTLNSIYYDFTKNDIFDPVGGLNDLKNGFLRTCGLTNFEDDPLRMLRAFRFISLFDFQIDPKIFEYIEKNAHNISKPAKERINYEIVKMFEGKNLVTALQIAHKTGLLKEVFPFVESIERIPPNSHHHLSLLEHSIETMRQIRIQNPYLKLAAFMHDIGKPALWKIEPCELLDPKGNLIRERHRFIGHEEYGAKLAKPILENLKFSKKQIEFITKMIAYHIYPSALMHEEDRTEKSLMRFLRKISPHTKELLELARADRLSARGVMVPDAKVQENLKNLEELGEFCERMEKKLESLPKLLDGKEIMALLNIPPSKKLGEIIKELEEAQLSGLVNTKDEAVEFLRSCRPAV